MLTSARTSHRLTPASAGGFTLVELLVSMLTGMIVIAAAYLVMQVAFDQAQNTFTRVDATQRARETLENIENQLHSACVGGSAPIQPGSTANSLSFLSYYGTAATAKPLYEQLTYNASAGTLIEAASTATETNGVWSAGASATTTTLLTNVASQSASTPVFQYYEYEYGHSDAAGNQYWIIPDGTNELPNGTMPNSALNVASGLSSANAAETVEVVIHLLVGPGKGSEDNTHLTALDDPVMTAISLRLTTPADYVPAGDAPANGATPVGYGPCD